MQKSPYESLAETYEAIRPSYPPELISDIISGTQISPSASLMEIGAGTGKASGLFLEQGFSVDAIELEDTMASILRNKYPVPKLSLSVGTFENWAPPRQTYDLIYCAQAFHWLDPETKFCKCRQYLRTGGHLALFWYDPMPAPPSPAKLAVEGVHRKYFGTVLNSVSVSMNARLTEIQTAPGFHLIFQKEYRVTLQNSAQQSLLALLSTPAFAQEFNKLPPQTQTRFVHDYTEAIDKHGGKLDAPMLYTLYILKTV